MIEKDNIRENKEIDFYIDKKELPTHYSFINILFNHFVKICSLDK